MTDTDSDGSPCEGNANVGDRIGRTRRPAHPMDTISGGPIGPSDTRFSTDIVEQIARTLALSYGRDPDAMAEWTEMCDAHSRPVPIWKVYEEQAEAVASKHLTGLNGGSLE